MKKRILWIIALCLAVLCLAACSPKEQQPEAPQPVQEPEVKIYFNVDWESYPLTDEGLPTRPSAGGIYRARFAVDGTQTDLFFDNAYLMAAADSFGFSGMIVDENNYVQEVIPVEYCAGGVGVLNYTVESFDGENLVCNAVSSFRGQRIKLKVNENTKVYNVGGEGLLVGMPGTIESNYPIRVIRTVLTDEAGNRTIVDRMLLNNTHVASGRAYKLETMELNTMLTKSVLGGFMEEGKTYTLSLEVAIANGQNFTLAQADGLTK